jgi:peptide-methionine (S)-S-oxide reductase
MLNRRSLLLIGAATAGAAVCGCGARAAPAKALPAPVADEHNAAASETIVLAGGCFWGVQGVFAHVKGVTKAVSGYCGGNANTAQYETVSTGTTGHAESVSVTFDPRQITLGQILQIYFSVATDPTQLNHQFPDEGPQYRGQIWCASAEQTRVVKAYIAQLEAAHVYKDPIVTKVTAAQPFFPAEDYHQDYLTVHPNEPYIAMYDIPKVQALKADFPAVYQARALRVIPA